MGETVPFNVRMVGMEIQSALQKLEKVVGPNYRLTFVGRCINEDIPDADIVVTSDDLERIEETVRRRRLATTGGNEVL